MLINEVMTSEMIVASPEDSLDDAVRLMSRHDIEVLPICEDGKLIGMISNLDITILGAASDHNLKHTKLRYLMSFGAKYVFENQSIEYGIQYMRDHHLRRLLVLDRSSKLVGSVTWGDLVRSEEDIEFLV